MTDAELATYSAHIAGNTDPAVVTAVAEGNHEAIANWYNEETEPEVWVFKDSVSRTELINAMDWVNEYASPGFKDDLEGIEFIVGEGAYDPRGVEARNALNACFAGAGASKANILNAAVRACTKVEQLYIQPTTGPGGGNGSTQQQSALAAYVGPVSVDDTRKAVAMIA